MSLRLLQKTVGEDPGRTSAGTKAALQPNSRGRGSGYPSRGGAPSAGAGAPESTSGGSKVLAPTVVGGFHGSAAQAAHIAATKKSMAAQSQADEWKQTSELAKVSGLGLKAVEERKQKEEEERERKREERRLQRLGQEKQKDEEAQKKLADCEERALCDSEAHETVKYESALIVRIAVEFGASGVWMKIAEARARGAKIPLDARKVYLLAHPDRCHLPEATDATAILNQQRPPEMTESRTNVGTKSGASLPGSKEAVAARVAAKREAKKNRP